MCVTNAWNEIGVLGNSRIPSNSITMQVCACLPIHHVRV